jgi:hypothetical protein
VLDIAYLRALRDALIEEGSAGVHHLLDQSGWTTFYIESPEDYGHARWLVRLSYLYHVGIMKKTPAEAEEFAAVDVERELDRLDPSEAVRAAFERRRPGRVGANVTLRFSQPSDADEVRRVRAPPPLEPRLVGEGDLPAAGPAEPPPDLLRRDAVDRPIVGAGVPEDAVETAARDHLAEAGDESVALAVAEDVEHRRVDDRPEGESRSSEPREIHRVPDEEARVDPPPPGLLARLSDRQRREVDPEDVVASPGEEQRQLARPAADVEHRPPDETGLGESDEHPLWPPDVPVRDTRVGGVVDVGDRSGSGKFGNAHPNSPGSK